jgi:hypothetical protein
MYAQSVPHKLKYLLSGILSMFMFYGESRRAKIIRLLQSNATVTPLGGLLP